MHELALCDALLKMVDSVAKDEELECVKKVTVEVGTLSGVIPAYLSDCWTAVTDGTAYQDTSFVVETLPGTEYDGVPLHVETEAGRARCLDCGAEFEADVEDLSCPDCGGKKLMPLTGRDMTLQEIEAV